ncbi:hypothetical protein HCG51_21920 [Tolypothrix sp. PCC 7910]|uniref:hypothetical protein n=1 Tax=Tolypothrix sp. PCC 7910 TaxID=2099387 RepID=UPI0014277BE7|nr:hypothetical protein [Tolypothrix sp. PCC 7910]QIR39103.1 hypothetical protein HCG51_21920 [Tolypothrix sp. PCC 7910]
MLLQQKSNIYVYVIVKFTSFSAKLFTLLIAPVLINPVAALAEKIPISDDGIYLESTSVGYRGKFVYFQTETINMFAGFGDVRRTIASHVMDCKTGYWQITTAIGYRDSFTEPNLDLTDEFQGRTFFAEPNTPFGNVYQTLCR